MPSNRRVVQTVELGGIRLHVLTVHPGIPGEADRAAREVSLRDPALVLADLDTEEGLRVLEALGTSRRRFEPSFVDALFAGETARRLGAASLREDHPLVAVARVARNRNAAFIALRPPSKPLGLFLRLAARSRARAIAPGLDAEAFTSAFVTALQARGAFDADAQARAAQPRLESALADGRAPVVAVVQAHRAAAFLRLVRELPRRTLA